MWYLKTKTLHCHEQICAPCSHDNNINLQGSGSCSHGTLKQEQLIYNQVAPAHMVIKQQYLIYNQVALPHMVLKNKNKFTNLKPSGPCSHGN